MELHQTSTTQNRHAWTLQTIPIHATTYDQISPNHQHQHHWNQQEIWLIHTKIRRHHHQRTWGGGGRNIGYISVGWGMGCIRNSPWRRSGPIWFLKPSKSIAQPSPPPTSNPSPLLPHRTPTPTLSMSIKERKVERPHSMGTGVVGSWVVPGVDLYLMHVYMFVFCYYRYIYICIQKITYDISFLLSCAGGRMTPCLLLHTGTGPTKEESGASALLGWGPLGWLQVGAGRPPPRQVTHSWIISYHICLK